MRQRRNRISGGVFGLGEVLQQHGTPEPFRGVPCKEVAEGGDGLISVASDPGVFATKYVAAERWRCYIEFGRRLSWIAADKGSDSAIAGISGFGEVSINARRVDNDHLS